MSNPFFKIQQILKNFPILFILISGLIFLGGYTGQEKSLSKTNLNWTDYYILKLNRIELPFSNTGVLGYVSANQSIPGGKFDGKTVLFSGGFLLGGYIKPGTANERLFVNGIFPTYRLFDYQPGKVGMDKDDPKSKIYIVQSSDRPFSKSWLEWKTAVELGAEFYDGDGDGIYNPTDKNNNGQWDTDEDKPNLIGDFTAWCVYNDGVPKNSRSLMIDPLGIEIHQTIWAYNYVAPLSNSIFIRYKIIFKGNSIYPDLNQLDSVIFSFINDQDIGDYLDDLLGTDTLLNSTYAYNEGADTDFSNNPPAFFNQMLQGPQAFIPGVSFNDNNGNGIFDEGDSPITFANLFIDPFLTRKIDGAKNLGVKSTNYIVLPSGQYTEFTLYNLMKGFDRFGKKYNPCQHDLGIVVGGVNCNDVNPAFVFSGDPVAYRGWINNRPFDVRSMINTEKFTLQKNKPVEIIFAYALGRGDNALSSINEARKYAQMNKLFYEKNFLQNIPLPVTELKNRTFDNRIDLFWETKDDLLFNRRFILQNQDTLLNLNFERYELWVHNLPEQYFGPDTTRSLLLATYDVENDIDNLYIVDKDGITIKNIFYKGYQLNPSKYSNPQTGIIIYSLDKNPFTGKKLRKGEKLYFTLKKFFLNRTAFDLAEISGKPKNYLITSSYEFAVKEKLSNIVEITTGENFNTPVFIDLSTSAGSRNSTEAKVLIEEIDKSKLTNDLYQISFKKKEDKTNYSLFWNIKNLTKNNVLLDSQTIYYNKDDSYVVVDGFFPKIEWIEPEVKSISYSPVENKWFKDFREQISGAFYLGSETIKNSYGLIVSPLLQLGTRKSTLTTFDKMRKIEIRFGKSQYAYRFISNSLGTKFFSAAQTSGQSDIGKPGQYFVSVPFQVWIKDERFNEERQLSCAFLESRSNLGGNPDGSWNPDTNISATREYIVVFNQSYDSTGRQMEYVGYLPTTGTKVYAELSGWNPPAEANFTSEQIVRANSPWFDALLVIGLEKISSNVDFRNGDKLTVPISYVITEKDTFYYQSKTPNNKLSTEERKELVNKINVFPNPYFEWKDERNTGRGLITFSNLPEEVTIKIYSLSGNLVKTLNESNKTSITSPFIYWDLRNEHGNKVADGVYLAYVKTKYGEKVLKFSVVKMRY